MLVDKLTSEAIVSEARNWVGTKWRHQGRNKHGIDCVGLILVTAWGVGIKMEDTIAYSKYYVPELMIAAFTSRNFSSIRPNKREPGDVLLVKIGRTPTHVGISAILNDKETIIHAYAPSRKTKEEVMYPMLENRITHVFRFPGL